MGLTREEALDEYCTEFDSREYIINSIYDDFENRTCENCQYYRHNEENKTIGFCMRHTNSCLTENTIEKDWYCKGIEDTKEIK